ncbi:MAG: SusF/SusE family outer membrane protein [Bacteroidales bacterium]|nr:SusF/SusE family outer membrane protein [Bacteroidales bacterium]
MKKVLSIISAAALLLLAGSCVKEKFATVDISGSTAPVLLSSQVGDDEITASYTPAVFKMDFNEKMPVYHSFVMVSLDGKDVNKALSSRNENNTLTLTSLNLNRALMSMGYKEGDVVSCELVIRASVQSTTYASDVLSYIDSEGRIKITGHEVTEPKGSPYIEYTEASDWTVTGALSAYGISWDGDLNMWTDGTNHVAAHVTLKAGDEFKFRKDLAWTENMGGEYGGLDNEFAVAQDGANIVIDADGVYDLFLNPAAGIAWVSAAFDPYPDYTEVSSWSVIGALSAVGINWDGDLAMITDGTWHVATGVALTEADEFKFRQDKAWTVNMGGEFGGLDNEFAVTQDGANIVVGAAGVYDLFVNPDAGLAKVTATTGAKISSVVGGDEPPAPVTVTGWNIIGLNGDWDNDVLATADGNVWTAYITAESDTDFKWRKDGAWDENYGGVMAALGEPFEAVAGGDNIKVGAGFWKVELNLDDMTITVSNGQVWSLIGDFNEWAGDVDMTLTDGKWVSPVTKISGGFKLRENHGWDNNRGGVFVAVGEPFEAVAGGDNITVEEGNYVVTYDPETETIVIDETGWGLVGTINGWGNTPDIILKEEGLFLVAKNVALTDSDEVKIRYKSSWDENRGGRTAVGHAVKAVPGGDNIKPGVAGNYDIWYRPDSEVIFVMETGSELSYWGVVGTINSWGAPDLVMYENEEGQFVYDEVTVTASDEIKIRLNEDWAENRGGTFTELGEPIPVEGNGPNVKVGRDAKFALVYDPAAETITLNGEYTGDPLPEFDPSVTMAGDYSGNNWSVDGDAHLFGEAGVYTGAITMYNFTYGFKVVHQGNWISGEGEGLSFTLGAGDNMMVADGTYWWNVNLVENTATALSIDKVGLIGSFNSWADDEAMTFDASTLTYTATLTLDAGAEVKVRFNGNWDYNLGGNLEALTPGGANLVIGEAGTYKVTLDLTHTAKITFEKQ